MLSIFLFVVVFSFLSWLSYKPHRTADQHQHHEDKQIVQIIDNRTPIPEQPASIAAKEQLTTDTLSATESLPELRRPLPPDPSLIEAARESASVGDAVASDAAQIPPTTPESEPEPVSIAAVASKDAPVSEASADEEAEIEPALTEEEAIALAVETTLAAGTTPKASEGDFEGAVSEPVRPNPPDPQLVEVAISDALEKSEDFSPPESVDPKYKK